MFKFPFWEGVYYKIPNILRWFSWFKRDFLMKILMDHDNMGLKEMDLRILANLEFWPLLEVWAGYGLVLGGRLGGRIENRADMLSWIKIECKMGLKTRRHAIRTSRWTDFMLRPSGTFWTKEMLRFGL